MLGKGTLAKQWLTKTDKLRSELASVDAIRRAGFSWPRAPGRSTELINEKKLPLLADMRDEFAEDVRIVFEPRSRAVDPALLMESLFKLTELESRVPLNMNVLIRGRIPKVVGLAEALQEWLVHRRDVLLRRSRIGCRKSSTGWRCWAAISSPISTSTRSSRSSARRTSRSRS